MADAYWRKLQRRFIYRMNKISEFMNSMDFDNACSSKDLTGLKILDLFARSDKNKKELQEYIAIV